MATLPLPQLSDSSQLRPTLSSGLLPILIGLALLLGLLGRLFSGLYAPLWFDETFTAEIASQTNLHDWVRWCLSELGGPVHYGLLFLWEKVAGNSNVALRLPSLAVSIAAPLLILWRGHPDRDVRLLWAAITALSFIGVDSATQARYYALLYLLATAQAILFLRMIERPTLRATMLWTGISALMVLTHYYAAIICGFQGIAFLALCRARALRTWPALIALVPMAAWMLFHLPFLASFASTDVVWNEGLNADDLWLLPCVLTGLAWPGAFVIVAMMASVTTDAVAALRRRAPFPYSPGEAALVAGAILSIALVMGAGFVVPSFNLRYLIPYVPALLLGLALWTRRMMRIVPLAGPLLITTMLGSGMSQLADIIQHPPHNSFNLEDPSAWLADKGVKRMVMLWDNPTAALPDPDGHLAAIGSFFLRRAHVPVDIVVPLWPRSGDPNRLLVDMASRKPGTAILWIYDTAVPGARGREHPWRIPSIDPAWECRDFGKGTGTVLACIR